MMGKSKYVFPLLFLAVLSVSLAASGQAQSDPLEVAFPSLTFNQPVGFCVAPDGTNRAFVIEQTGTIWVFPNSQDSTSPQVFLDISDRLLFGGEQGLLGLAFHQNHEVNGFFYVNYVAPNPTRTVIARYRTTEGNPNQADKNSEFIFLEISQPFSNHKGGQLAFGPDGYLYIGLGDGGSQGDPLGNGQNRSNLLGKILRIDVNSPSASLNYSIPPSNPFVDNTLGYREEIYAYGFRNPWRFSFDSETGRLWVGDVGQNWLEEIDVVEKGKNYGWNLMEGTLPYAGGDLAGLELPVYEYNHTLGVAIIGGYVYRGSVLPQLEGSYIYGDYGSGRIWALSALSDNSLLVDSNLTISSFGIDGQKELYICAFNGKIYKFNNTVIAEFESTIVILLVVSVALPITLSTKRRHTIFPR